MSNFSTDLWSILAPEVWPTHDERPECVYNHCKGELTIFWLRAVHLPQGWITIRFFRRQPGFNIVISYWYQEFEGTSSTTHKAPPVPERSIQEVNRHKILMPSLRLRIKKG